MLLKHYEYGRVLDVIHTAVVKDGVSSVFGGGAGVAGVADGVVTHQDTADEHAASCGVSGVVVRVFRILGKITPCREEPGFQIKLFHKLSPIMLDQKHNIVFI